MIVQNQEKEPKQGIGQTFRSRIMQEHWHGGQNATNRYKELLAGLIKPGMRILHGGCGWDKNEVSRPFKDSCRVVGIDLDPRVQSLFHSEFHLASLATMPFADESFDMICSEYVLEHVEDPRSAFREMARVLKRGGHIVILTPNLYSYKALAAWLAPWKLHLLMGRTRYGAGREEDMYRTLYRCNTSRRFRHLARTSNLHIKATHFVTNGPTWFAKFPVIFTVFHLFHLLLERWELLRQLRCALIVELQKG